MREAPSRKPTAQELPVSKQDSGVYARPDRAIKNDPYIKALTAPLGEWATPYIGKIPDAALRRLNVPQEEGGYSPDVRAEMLSGWEAGTFSFAKSERKRQPSKEDQEVARDLVTRIRNYSDDETRVLPNETSGVLDEKTRVVRTTSKAEVVDKKKFPLGKKEGAAVGAPPELIDGMEVVRLDPSVLEEWEEPVAKPRRAIPEIPRLKVSEAPKRKAVPELPAFVKNDVAKNRMKVAARAPEVPRVLIKDRAAIGAPPVPKAEVTPPPPPKPASLYSRFTSWLQGR